MKRKNTFTLIELLVVTAIIGVLVSILLPGLVQAKDSAKSVKCMNQQKQIFTVIQLYMSDWEGFLPKLDKLDRLDDYSQVIDRDAGSLIWTCPSAVYSYDYISESNPITYCYSKTGLDWVTWKNSSRIFRPSKNIIFTDGRVNKPWGAWIFMDGDGDLWGYEGAGWQTQSGFLGNGYNLEDPVYVINADAEALVDGDAPSGSRYRHRMMNATNTLFFDGHAETISKYGLTRENFVTSW
ncbi:MAG: type II secretion system GspH family protein [Lentisphaeria bacterium]|nr:type II secretion system GspH family protein [Lentisphaeria bacterium]